MRSLGLSPKPVCETRQRYQGTLTSAIGGRIGLGVGRAGVHFEKWALRTLGLCHKPGGGAPRPAQFCQGGQLFAGLPTWWTPQPLR